MTEGTSRVELDEGDVVVKTAGFSEGAEGLHGMVGANLQAPEIQ